MKPRHSRNSIPEFISQVRLRAQVHGAPAVTVESTDVVCAFNDRGVIQKGRINVETPEKAQSVAARIRAHFQPNVTDQRENRPSR